MAKEYIKAIASAVLLTQILDCFLVVGVEQAATEIKSSLDELPDKVWTDDIHLNQRALWSLFMLQNFLYGINWTP